MYTQAHLIVGLALAGRSGWRTRLAGAVGGILPDAAILTLLLVGLVARWSGEEIWGDRYFDRDTFFFWGRAIGNSLPLWLLLSLIGWGLRQRWLLVFALAGLLHAFTDLLLHYDDGHPHFWPFTTAQLVSPVSYWDVSHCAGWWMPIEALTIMALMGWVFFQSRALAARLLMGVLSGATLAIYLVALVFTYAPSASTRPAACDLSAGFSWRMP